MKQVIWRCSLLAMISLAAAPAYSAADNWPRFRGPDGAGISDDRTIPAQWSDSDFAWKVDLPGKGHSSPVVWGERVFVTSADEATGDRILQCRRAHDGSVMWERKWEDRTFAKHMENSFASSTPAVDAKHIYLVWTTPERLLLIALDHDGKDVWREDLGPYVTQHGGGASPIVFENLLIFPNDQDGRASFIVALDCDTGKVRWKTPRKSTRFAASTPILYQPPGGGATQLVLSSHAHGVTGVDPKTGKILWEVNDVFSQRVVASPTSTGGLVFASCGEGPRGKNLVAVKPGDGETPASVVYTLTQDVPYVPTTLARDGLLFMWSDMGTVSCLEAESGNIVWRERLRGVGPGFFSSPVCLGDKLFCVSKEGTVYVVSATRQFKLLATNDLEDRSHATPAVAGGRMILRTYSHLMCVGGKAVAQVDR